MRERISRLLVFKGKFREDDNLKGRRLYEWLLTLVYIAMIGVCVYLNVFSSQKEGTASIIVNAVMFAIVGIIFLSCEINSFKPVNSMILNSI